MKRRRCSLQPFSTALYSFNSKQTFYHVLPALLINVAFFTTATPIVPEQKPKPKPIPARSQCLISLSASCAHAAGPLDPSQTRPAFCRSKRPFWTTTIRRPPCGLSRICNQRPAGTYARLELRENASGFAGMLHRHSSLQASSLVVVSAWRFFPMPRCPLVSVHACDHSSLSRVPQYSETQSMLCVSLSASYPM